MNDKKLWTAFSKFIRLRDADENGYCKCFTCGLVRKWSQMDAGHGIPRQHWGTRYSEINVQVQCKKCNGFNQGMQAAFKDNINKKYTADTWDRLEVASRKAKRLSQFEVDEMEKYYSARIKTGWFTK
jgi:hypothetical protein